MSAAQALAAKIAAEEDVAELLRLVPLEDGKRWAYAIRTPFETFPAVVVGTTNAANTVVRHFGFGSSEFCLDSLWEDMMRRLNKGGLDS